MPARQNSLLIQNVRYDGDPLSSPGELQTQGRAVPEPIES